MASKYLFCRIELYSWFIWILVVGFLMPIVPTTLNAQELENNTRDSLKIKIMELQKRLEKIEEKQAQTELEKLKEEALQQISRSTEEPEQPQVFKSGQRSLQAMNPELSVTGDVFLQRLQNAEGFNVSQRTGAYFRVLGIHVQSNLDPFSLTKIALGVHPDGVELGEAYVIWANLFKNISLTAGKFRQQFGVINRWHAHSLDQFDFPLAMTTILGNEGLNQIGFSIDWLMPGLWAHANTLTLQITNGQNDHLFAGALFSFPAVLGHLKNYYDLNPDTYLEIGLTAMVGQNNQHGYLDGQLIKEKRRLTKLGGLDFTLNWEPLNRAHYRSLTWRSELYYANKEESLSKNNIKAWGGYSYLQYRFNERWYAGIRFDYTQPFISENSGKNIYQIVPYLTWWQSHWVRFRFQYNYTNGNVVEKPNHLIRLQLTWAAGPHKHERY